MQFLKKSIWEFYDDRYRIPFIYLRFNEKQYTVGAISGTSLYEGLDEKIEEAVNNEPWESVTVYLKEREVQLISYHVSDLSSGQKLYDLVLALDLAQFSTVLSDGKIGESGRIMVVDSHGESIYPSTVSDENWNEVQEYLHEQKLLQVTRQESVLHRFGRWQVLTARTRFQNWYVVGYMLTDEVISDIFDPFMVWLIPGLALIITRHIYHLVFAQNFKTDYENCFNNETGRKQQFYRWHYGNGAFFQRNSLYFQSIQ